MSNAADGYLGDWLPHKDNCRCTDCSLERAQQKIRTLTAERDALKAENERLKIGPCCREPWCKGECACEVCAPDLALRDLKSELTALRERLAEMEKPVSIREWWYKEARPIINAIGEISVQEAMDAIERYL